MIVSRSELIGKTLATAKAVILISQDKLDSWEEGELYLNVWEDEDLPHTGSYDDFAEILKNPDKKYDRFRQPRKDNFVLEKNSDGDDRYCVKVNTNDEMYIHGSLHSEINKGCSNKVSECDIIHDVFRKIGVVNVDSDELLNWGFCDTAYPDGNGFCEVIFMDLEDYTDRYYS